MTQFTPQNAIETALVQTQAGLLPMHEFLALLMISDIAVPSGNEIAADGTGFQPLLFSKDGVQMVACFTDRNRVKSFASMAPYCLVMKGKKFFSRLAPKFGVVVNPGETVGFDIPPTGVKRIVADFG
jgi:hypothetical protein